RARLYLNRKITASNCFRDRSHFLEIDDHAIECAGQFSQLVVAIYVDCLVKIARFADLSSDADQRFQRFSNGFAGKDRQYNSTYDGQEGKDKRNGERVFTGGVLALLLFCELICGGLLGSL